MLLCGGLIEEASKIETKVQYDYQFGFLERVADEIHRDHPTNRFFRRPKGRLFRVRHVKMESGQLVGCNELESTGTILDYGSYE